MEISDLLAFISAIAASTSAIVALASCIVSIKNNKPQITIEPMCDVNQSGYLSFLYDKTVHTLAFFEVQFVNSASVSGTIKNAYICIDKKKYYFEQVGSTYTTPATMSFAKPIDINAYRLQLPLVVAPHSVVKGFFLVPEFPVITDDFIRASIVFDLVRWKRHFNAQKFQVIVNRLNIDPQVQ